MAEAWQGRAPMGVLQQVERQRDAMAEGLHGRAHMGVLQLVEEVLAMHLAADLPKRQAAHDRNQHKADTEVLHAAQQHS